MLCYYCSCLFEFCYCCLYSFLLIIVLLCEPVVGLCSVVFDFRVNCISWDVFAIMITCHSVILSMLLLIHYIQWCKKEMELRHWVTDSMIWSGHVSVWQTRCLTRFLFFTLFVVGFDERHETIRHLVICVTLCTVSLYFHVALFTNAHSSKLLLVTVLVHWLWTACRNINARYCN